MAEQFKVLLFTRVDGSVIDSSLKELIEEIKGFAAFLHPENLQQIIPCTISTNKGVVPILKITASPPIGGKELFLFAEDASFLKNVRPSPRQAFQALKEDLVARIAALSPAEKARNQAHLMDNFEASSSAADQADAAREQLKVVTVCMGCGKLSEARLKKCAKCQMAEYCSKECQKKDWKVHKKICRTTSDGRV